MDNNNNNNMMELNTEETQKKKERQEKIDNFKKKIKGFKDKLKEDKEDRQREKEEKERVKEQERLEKEATKQQSAPSHSNGGFSDITVTNETIQKETTTKVKKEKPKLSASEERRRKAKRKRIIRNIMTIPEIIAVILLALFLKDKYIDYSKNVHQILNYTSDNYVYEIHRDNDAIKVVKNYRKECAVAPCELDKLSEYDIKFGKKQMTVLRVFMDFKFMFKSTTKTITLDDVKTDWGKKCIYSMVHNSNYFVGFKSYKKYSIIEFEQMSSDYTQKGFKYESGDKTVNIAMGEKPSSGYNLVVTNVYKQNDDIYIYVKEQTPGEGDINMTVVTHPVLRLQLEEAPKNIYVYNVDSGEEYPNYDAPSVPNAEPSMVQNRKAITGIVGDLVGTLKKELEED